MTNVERLCVVILGMCATIAAQVGAQGQCLGEAITGPGAADGDEFATAVAIDGDVAVIGAPLRDEGGGSAGAAYVYRFDGTSWVLEQELVRPDPAAGDYYGFAVALYGDMAVVASVFDDDQGPDAGAVYTFRYDGSEWTFEQKLIPFAFARDEWFGFSIDLTGASIGAIMAIGAPATLYPADLPGSVYVFRHTGSQWQPEQQLFAVDRTIDDQFGFAVAATPEALLIGTPSSDDAGESTGSAYIFRGTHGAWFQEQKLLAPVPEVGARFGRAVTFADGNAVVGAPNESTYGQAAGAVHVYDASASWGYAASLQGSDTSAKAAFGWALDADAAQLVVGSPGEYGDWSAAYTFTTNGTEYVETRRIDRPCGVGPSGEFGRSVGISGGVAMIGAPRADELCQGDTLCNVGSAYAFDAAGSCDCPADINGDGMVDTRDVLAFLALWAEGDCRADFDHDGSVNTRDVLVFLNAFAAGCE